MENPFKDKLNSEIIEIIDEYIHSERDRIVLKRIYVDDIRYEPLAAELDLSVSTINRINKKHKYLIESLCKEKTCP